MWDLVCFVHIFCFRGDFSRIWLCYPDVKSDPGNTAIFARLIQAGHPSRNPAAGLLICKHLLDYRGPILYPVG
jgi:hypothetical protein